MTRLKNYLLINFLLFTLPLIAQDCYQLWQEPIKPAFQGKMRQNTLKTWDRLLTWTFSKQIRSYPLIPQSFSYEYQVDDSIFNYFDDHYGFFSIYHPLVGTVTTGSKDLDVTQCFLLSIAESALDPKQKQLTIDEVLTKILAYRTLKKGDEITIPILGQDDSMELVVYQLDEIIDLWRGMPAFGLVPKNGAGPYSILLFRGTDLSLTTERGWASILSDLDISGPGYRTFMRAQERIHDWLEKVSNAGYPARVLGMSLGGAFTAFTVIYERELLFQEPWGASVAFNPPGVSKRVLQDWQKIPLEEQVPFRQYIVAGDLVSSIGSLFGEVFLMELSHPLQAISAHVTMITLQAKYFINQVNIEEENSLRRK